MAKKATNNKKKGEDSPTPGLDNLLRFLSGRPQDMSDFYMPFKNPVGRPLLYTPEELASEFARYVEWCKDHPLEARGESQTTGRDFSTHTESECRPRLVSIGGFLVFIGGCKSWWSQLDKRERGEEFMNLKAHITEYCESYQLEMASAGFLKQNIISRLLGLTDKKEVNATGDGFKIEVNNEETADRLKRLLDGETDEDNKGI